MFPQMDGACVGAYMGACFGACMCACTCMTSKIKLEKHYTK